MPSDLMNIFKTKEIKRSLRTKNIKYAKILAVTFSHQLERLFMMIRCKMLDDKQIDALVKEFFDKTLQEFEYDRIEGIGVPTLDELEDPENEEMDSYGPHYEGCKVAIDGGIEAFITKNYDYITPITDDLLEEKGIKVDKNSHEYKVLCNEMLKAWIKVHKIEKSRILEQDTLQDIFAMNTKEEVAKESNEGIPLSKAIKMFLEEKVLKKEFNEKTVTDSQGIFDVLLEVMGDVDISTVDKEAAMKFAAVVNKLPKNKNKRKEYRGKTISEMLKTAEKRKEKKLLSNTSKAKYVERASMLMKWCVDADFIKKNYFKNLSVKHDEDDEEKRRPYTSEELEELRDALVTKAIKIKKANTVNIKEAHKFFIPLIGLFAGMRMNEICQLYTSDIQEIQGIWCIDINKNTPDKRLKNKSARRTVPIHPVLIDAGLIKFKKFMEKQGHERMWIGLKYKRKTYKEAYQKTFARFCDKNITTDDSVNFHTFRNTLVDNLKQQEVNEAPIAAMEGHKHPNITFAVYGQAYKPKPLLEVLLKLDYAVIFKDIKFPIDKLK